jgi:hypothetical protein
MLSYLSRGDAVKHVWVRYVATFYGACDIHDPLLAVTQHGLRFIILKWARLKIKFQIVSSIRRGYGVPLQTKDQEHQPRCGVLAPVWKEESDNHIP